MKIRKTLNVFFLGSLLLIISCEQKKTFSEILKEKSDSLKLLKSTYNANYFKDSVNVHFIVKANYINGKIKIFSPVYRVPGKFFNVYEGIGAFEVRLLGASNNLIKSYKTLPPDLIIAHESDPDSIIHTISSNRVPFNVHFPADSNIKFIGFKHLKSFTDTIIGVPDSMAVIQ